MEPVLTVEAHPGALGAEMSLAGKRALVTGAASGIGRAVAQHLSRLGAQVAFSDIDPKPLYELTKGLSGASTVVADLAVAAQVVHLAQVAGPVDILVNNAGLQRKVGPAAGGDADRSVPADQVPDPRDV